MLTKEPEMLQQYVLRAYNAAKCDCGQGSAPDPAGGAYSAPQDSLAGFKGGAAGRGGEERKGEGRGREGRERRDRETEGREVEVDSDAQLEQGRRLAKAGPDAEC